MDNLQLFTATYNSSLSLHYSCLDTNISIWSILVPRGLGLCHAAPIKGRKSSTFPYWKGFVLFLSPFPRTTFSAPTSGVLVKVPQSLRFTTAPNSSSPIYCLVCCIEKLIATRTGSPCAVSTAEKPDQGPNPVLCLDERYYDSWDLGVKAQMHNTALNTRTKQAVKKRLHL